MNSFTMIAAASLSLIFIFIILYVYRKNAGLTAKYHVLESKLENMKQVFHYGPELMCYWFDNEQFVECSTDLYKILHLDPLKPLRLEELIKVLGPTSFSPFPKALIHLNEFGGEFTIYLNIFEGELNLMVKGRKIYFEPNDPFNSVSKQGVNILTFANFTPLLKDQMLQTQAQQSKDLDNLRVLFDMVPFALWARDKHGRIAYCNISYAGALETSVHRVIAENKELIIGNNSSYGTYELFHRALETQRTQTIRTHVIVSGERRYVEISELPVVDSQRTVGYALDITEIEDIQDKLESVNRAQREVLDLLSTAIAIYGPDKRILYFNGAYQRLFDYEAGWLESKPTLGEVLENLRERRKLPEYADFQKHKRDRLHLFSSMFQPIHEMVYQPDGRILRMVIASHPFGGIMYMFDDITDTLALERGYKTLMAVQRETLDHLYEGVVVFGTDSRLRLCNPAFRNIWSLREEDTNQLPHISEIFTKVRGLFADPAQNDALMGKVQELLEKRQTKKGTFHLIGDIALQYTFVPLPDGSYLISFVDMSDQQRLQHSLKERTRALEDTERLKNTFMSHISYELKSPLNTITGFSEILTNGYFGELNEKQLDYCNGISESADKLMNLINDMIDLANIEAGTLNLELQEVSLKALINSAISLLQTRATDQGLEIKTTFTGLENDLITLDTRRIKHVLFNVMSNSIKFTPAGGKISIKVFESKQTDNEIQIDIIDTGVGINENDRDRVFQIFEHGKFTQNAQKGAGIGLTVVKRLIELHNGHVKIESQKNKGTKVSLFIPRSQPNPLAEVSLIDPGLEVDHAEL